jgi:predicted transcriptional regulator
LEIIADILQVVSRNAKKTEILYKANLSYKVLQKYLRIVTAASLIDFESGERCYMLTTKGREFLESYMDYAKTNESVEKHLEDINNKKKILEELCSNG